MIIKHNYSQQPFATLSIRSLTWGRLEIFILSYIQGRYILPLVRRHRNPWRRIQWPWDRGTYVCKRVIRGYFGDGSRTPSCYFDEVHSSVV